MSDTLKPCPKCWSEAFSGWNLTDAYAYVVCSDHECGLSTINMRYRDHDDAAKFWNQRVEDPELAALRAHVARLEAGIHAVRELIEESIGVYGLHGNGDVAPWDDLLRGGQFEDCLHGFSDAQAAIAERALKEAKP